MLDALRHAWPQFLFDWDYLQKRTEDLERAYLRRECFDLSFAHPEPGMLHVSLTLREHVLTGDAMNQLEPSGLPWNIRSSTFSL
jgi:hypothetical protein